ncbi:hypothetical protein QJQ45_018487, partial [Haematococcus lacustris]
RSPNTHAMISTIFYRFNADLTFDAIGHQHILDTGSIDHRRVELGSMAVDLLPGPNQLPLYITVPLSLLAVLLTAVLTRILANYLLNGSRPPVFEGVPFVGGLLKFAVDKPMKLMSDGYAKHGEAFTVPVAHKRITFLIGPDVAPHFFKATDDEMSQSEVYSFNVPTFGPGVVYDVDQKTRTEQFRWFTEALKKDRLRAYVPQFVAEAEQYFAQWGNEGVVDFAQDFAKLVTLTAARTLLGREVREQLFEQVTDLMHDLDAGMLPVSVMFPYLPIPAHFARDKARKQLRDIFGKVIQARRASGRREEDVLQQFIDARYQNVNNGRASNEDEITGLLIATLFAGQHTSSITTAWTGLHMAADKGKSLAAALEEQRAVMRQHGSTLDFDILSGMDVLHRNITEALRMHPPLILLMRYAKQPFTITTSSGRKFTVPKGDVVAASPNFSHMLPHVFKEPEHYDPLRFAEPREEDKARQFAFIGFGGGRHGCIGSNFAYLQIKTILSVLLRNFDIELLDPLPAPDYNSMQTKTDMAGVAAPERVVSVCSPRLPYIVFRGLMRSLLPHIAAQRSRVAQAAQGFASASAFISSRAAASPQPAHSHAGRCWGGMSCSVLSQQLALCYGLSAGQQLRSYAAKPAAKPAATAAPAKLSKDRRSNKRLFSCRNDRVRAMFDQIWPTQQLSEEELQLFRRNSRVFVTDLGRSISLKAKFQLAKAGAEKVPHQEVKQLLYESDLHLDAVGEHPRYLKIRRLRGGNYGTKLQALRKLRVLLGFARRHHVQYLYHQSLLQPGPDRVWKLVTAMESTLALSTLRMGFGHDILAIRGMLARGSIHLNGSRPAMPERGVVQPGDILQPARASNEWFKTYTASQLGLQLMREVASDWAVQGPLA